MLRLNLRTKLLMSRLGDRAYNQAHLHNVRMCIHHEEVSPYWRSGKGVGWGKLGDTCLSFGEKYTSGLKNLGRVVSHHGGGRYPCPLCENSEFDTTVMEHIMECHKPKSGTERGKLMKTLRELNISFLPKFRNLYILN